MDVDKFIKDLSKLDVTLWSSDGKIRFRGPKGALKEHAKATIRENHAAILAFLVEMQSVRDIPLAEGQRSLWFVHQQAPLSSAYNLGTSVRIRGQLRPEELEQAYQRVVNRHAALRASFPTVAGRPVQRIARDLEARLECHRLDGSSEQALLLQVKQMCERPFDLKTGPVSRLALFRMAEDDHVILLAAHHIICDATAGAIALHDLKQFYLEAVHGVKPVFSQVTGDFPEFVEWQRETLLGPRGKALRAHWKERLKPPLPVMNLPTDWPRPTTRRFNGDTVIKNLDARQVSALDSVVSSAQTTRPTVLMATLAALLGRISEADEVMLGTPFLGRIEGRFSETVGYLADPLPIRLNVAPDRSLKDLLSETRERLLDALDHQEMPLLRLIEELNPLRDSTRMPFFDVLFTFLSHNHLNPSARRAGRPEERSFWDDEPYPFTQMEGQFDLSLRIEESESDVCMGWSFDTDLFDRSTIEVLVDLFETLLTKFADDASSLIGTVEAARFLQHRKLEQQEFGMEVHALFDRLADRGVTLSLDGAQLRINAPKGAIDGNIREELVRMKPAILEFLEAESADVRPHSAQKANLPLSYAQQRLWFLNRLDPLSTAFNVGSAAWVEGVIVPSFIVEAFTLLAKRHDALRMRFTEKNGSPVAEAVDGLMPKFEYLDLEHVAPELREKEAERIIGERLRQPFDLATGPLCAFTLIRLADDRHATLFLAHHIIVDGWSLAIAHNEIIEIYDTLVDGRQPDLPPVKAQATEHARRERRMAISPEWAAHIDFWREELKGAPAVIDLPTDRRRPVNQTYEGGRLIERFDAQLLAGLNALARSEGVTLFMLLMAGWAATLYRYSGQSDIVLGAPHANRNEPDQEGMIGCLINNMVIWCRINGALSFSDYLADIRASTLSALEHCELPFDLLVDTVNPERSASHAPIFQALFSLMSFPKTEDGFKNTKAEPIVSGTGASRYDLALDCVEFGSELLTNYEFATSLFDVSTIERLHRHYRALMRAAVADPTATVNALQMLTCEDQDAIAETNNKAVRDFDRSVTALDMFEACVREAPAQSAVTDARGTLTYAQLDRRANKLANLLRDEGVGRNSLVAVNLDRSIYLPIALLAIWKAGGAYLPLDPKHPEERINGIISDANVDIIITDSSTVGNFASDQRVLRIEELAMRLADMSDVAPDRESRAEDLAYVIYTSGSTGRPKGVEVEQRNLAAFLVAMRDKPGIAQGQTLLSVTTPSFDIFGLEAWLPLTSKARVVISSRETALDGRALAELIEQENVNILQATPATWNVLIETGWQGHVGLKALCGGEALPQVLAEALLERRCELWNMYGPTETTIWSTLQKIEKTDDAVSIGEPIVNTRVYILDDQGVPVPPGAIGELCIGGEGVSRGYRGQPDLTSDRFVTLDLPGRHGERIYRTGDYARETSAGRLVYLGRRDFQVKVRGFRIELGEIEGQIRTHENVADCVVTAIARTQNDLELVAYVVPAAGQAVDPGVLRVTLRSQVPNYMVPSYVVVLDALPLTPNLKVDRKALPSPDIEKHVAITASNIVMSSAERSVAEIWCSVLGLSQVGLGENFFDIGGHSMLLVRLHERLRSDLGATMPLVELFQRTTVAQQASVLTGGEIEARSKTSPDIALQSDRLARAKKRAERLRHD